MPALILSLAQVHPSMICVLFNLSKRSQPSSARAAFSSALLLFQPAEATRVDVDDLMNVS